MVIEHDMREICKNPNAKLDEMQRYFIQKVAEDQPKNIFLWGSSGTGKTLLLTQALNIKLSYYKKLGLPINVFVSSYTFTDDQLMEDFRQKYLINLKDSNVRFISLKQLFLGMYAILLHRIFTSIKTYSFPSF